MNLFEIIVLDTIYVGFPILIYLFYVAYNKNIDRDENDLIFDFVLFMSFYLIYRFGGGLLEYPILAINVPLIIAYIKNRTRSIIILSIIIVVYYFLILNFSLYVLILEYIFYYLIFKILKTTKNYAGLFIIIKMVFILLLLRNVDLPNLLTILLSFGALYVIVIILLILIFKGEEIISYHMSIKSIEEEKQLRDSLFKITHEIKNPLAVIKGYLEMFDKNNSDHINRYIPIIKEEVDKTLLLLQDFLCMTKIKTDKDLMDVNLLLNDLCQTIKPILHDKDIKFKSTINDKEIYISGDYNRLMQVLINIIKNSIESIDKKGVIELIAKEQTNMFEIIIKDNGYGMDNEILSKIKEPFFTTKRNGTGLGVSLSYEIIKQHNGDIDYKSKEKEGTTVTITLPKLS